MCTLQGRGKHDAPVRIVWRGIRSRISLYCALLIADYVVMDVNCTVGTLGSQAHYPFLLLKGQWLK